MHHSPLRFVCVFLVAVFGVFELHAAVSGPPDPVLSSSRIEKGVEDSAVTLTVLKTGRYSVLARSSLPCAIELVDKMAGTVGSSASDRGLARVDIFLEPGVYNLRVSKRMDAVADLEAWSFGTINAGPGGPFDVPVFSDGQELNTQLGDRQIAAWWVNVTDSSAPLIVEMMGRNLAGAELWKDGIWSLGRAPLARRYNLSEERPIRYFEYNAALEPGAYLLICYGGPPEVWGDSATAEPFFIRKGARYLGAMGSFDLKIGESGMESFLVAGSTNRMELEVPRAGSYRLAASSLGESRSRLDAYASAVLDPKSDTLRSVITGASGNRHWVVVQGPPGETVKLRFFPISPGSSTAQTNLSQSGTWISSIMGSFASDDQGPFAIMTSNTASIGGKSVTTEQRLTTVSLSGGNPLHLNINNFGTSSYIVSVEEAGTYTIHEKTPDVTARYSFRPLDEFMNAAPGQAIRIAHGQNIPLLPGPYVMAVEALNRGVLEFVLTKGPAASAFSGPVDAAVRGYTITTAVPNDRSTTRISVMPRGGVPFGIVNRRMPIDLGEPLYVELAPGERTRIDFRNTAPVMLSATAPVRFGTLDGVPWDATKPVPPGSHYFSIAADSTRGSAFVIGATAVAEEFSPPTVTDPADLYPRFSLGKDIWRDFDREESAYFSLVVETAGPYRIETSGRLAMTIELRSPLRPALFTGNQNTNGRNALVSAYLKEGTYLVRATTAGRSRGRAGLSLIQPRIDDAGTIGTGDVARADVDAQALLSIDLDITQKGMYVVESLGLGRRFTFRLEDSDGWPIGQPTMSGRQELYFDKGRYRYVSYPDTVLTRRIVRVTGQDLPPVPLPAGSLPLSGSTDHTWKESAERVEDAYFVDVPAPMRFRFSISEGMEYRVVGPDNRQTFSGIGEEPQQLDLATGRNRLFVRSIEIDNEKPYTVRLFSEDLTEKTPRRMSQATGAIPVAVGQSGFVEIWSYGSAEVEASLWDEAGQTLFAESERIPGDWNFRIVARLEPGRYVLYTGSPGSAGSNQEYDEQGNSGPVTLTLVTREEREFTASGTGFEIPAELRSEVARVRFTPDQAGPFRFGLDNDISAVVSVAQDGKIIASGRTPYTMALAKANYDISFTLNAAPEASIRLIAAPTEAASVTIGNGQTVTAPIAAGSAVAVNNPDGYSFTADSPTPLLYSAGPGRPFVAVVSGELLNTVEGTGWLIPAHAADAGSIMLAAAGFTGDGLYGLNLGNVRQALPVSVPADFVALITAYGAKAPPGLGLIEKNRTQWFSGTGDQGEALIGVAGETVVALWNPLPSITSQRVRLDMRTYPFTGTRNLAMGKRTEAEIPAHSAVVYEIGDQGRTLDLGLQKGLAAFIWPAQGGEIANAIAHSISASVVTQGGGKLVIVNTRSEAALYVVTASGGKTLPRLAEGRSVELANPGTEVLTVPVTAATGKTIRIAGGSARFYSEDDGFIHESRSGPDGNYASLPSGTGRVEILPDGGPLRLWIDTGNPAGGLWGSYLPSQANPLNESTAALSPRTEAWSFSLEKDTVVRLQSDGQGIVALSDRKGSILAADMGAEGVLLIKTLPAGQYRVLTRPVGSEARTGILRLAASDPIDLVADGPGNPALISSGEQGLYRFALADPSRVGIGVSGENETLTLTLYDAEFNAIGHGGLMIRDLEQGTYYVIVETENEAQRYTVLLYGVQGNRTDIPDDVRRSYIPTN